jgi:hypothetical protein
MTISNPLTLILLGMILIKLADFIIPIFIKGLVCPIIEYLNNRRDDVY